MYKRNEGGGQDLDIYGAEGGLAGSWFDSVFQAATLGVLLICN